MDVTVQTAKDLGLTPEEFDMIKEILGRTPNFTELSIYSVMWSEHASYKNSIKWLKTLPREVEYKRRDDPDDAGRVLRTRRARDSSISC